MAPKRLAVMRVSIVAVAFEAAFWYDTQERNL